MNSGCVIQTSGLVTPEDESEETFSILLKTQSSQYTNMRILSADLPFGPSDPLDCFVHPTLAHSLHFIKIHSNDKNIDIVLRTISNPYVKVDELIVQNWISDYIDAGNTEISGISAEIDVMDSNINISFEFIAYRKFENWDEMSSSDGFHVPCSFTGSWPSTLCTQLMLNILQSFIKRLQVCQNSHVVLDCLDAQFVFKIYLEDIDANDSTIFIVNTKQMSSITLFTKNDALMNRNSLRIDQPQVLSFMQPTFTAITQSILLLGSSNGKYQSLLISAAPGAGKSTLLSLITTFSKSLSTLQVLHIPLRNIKSSQADQTRRDIEEVIALIKATNESLYNVNSVETLVVTLFRLSCGSCQVYDPKSPLLITLDDVDALLSAISIHFGSRDEPQTPAYDDTLLTYAALMKCILSTLSSRAAGTPPHVLVVGSTSFLSAELPSGNLGAPVFEKVLNMSKPLLLDRIALLSGFLTKYAALESLDWSISPNKTPLEIWSQQAASLCRGYLPGDLVKVMRRVDTFYAADEPEDRISATPTPLLWKHILSAMASVRPRQLDKIQELVHAVDVDSGTTLEWDDLAGYKTLKISIKRILRQLCLDGSSDLTTANRFKSLSQSLQRQRGGIVLHGGSGNGKSYIARIIASQVRVNFLSVRCTELMSKYFGETEANIRAVFHNAVAPCLLFFDEFDVFAHKRNSDDDSNGLNSRILSTFLNELDGATSRGGEEEGGITVMVACSSLPSLDDALVRPGRLSHHLHIPNPTQEDILAILNYKLDPITIHGNCNLGSVAEELTLWNPSCADVDFIFKETVMDAMRSIIDNHNDHENQDELSYLISKDNFDRALRARYGEKIFPIRSSTMNNSFKFKISDNGFNFT